MKQFYIETILLVVFLFGTILAGGHILYQINTTDFKGIIQSGMNK
jgi:hypothetical protein